MLARLPPRNKETGGYPLDSNLSEGEAFTCKDEQQVKGEAGASPALRHQAGAW